MTNQTKIEWCDFTGRQLGAFKAAAKKLGVTFNEYKALRDAGLLDLPRTQGKRTRHLQCGRRCERAEARKWLK